MFRLIRSFDTGHGNPIGAACFTSPVENNHNELRATGDRETVLGSRLYREGARHVAITPAIYCPPTVGRATSRRLLANTAARKRI